LKPGNYDICNEIVAGDKVVPKGVHS